MLGTGFGTRLTVTEDFLRKRSTQWTKGIGKKAGEGETNP